MLFYSPAQRYLYALAPLQSIQSQAFRIAASPKWTRRRIKWFKFAAKARIHKSKICSATKTGFASALQKSGNRSVLRMPALNLTILKPRSSARKRSRPRFNVARNLKLAPLHALMHFIYLILAAPANQSSCSWRDEILKFHRQTRRVIRI